VFPRRHVSNRDTADISAAGAPFGHIDVGGQGGAANCRRSMSTITCLRHAHLRGNAPLPTPIHHVPLGHTERTSHTARKPSDLAIASAVVESRPPLKSTTALGSAPARTVGSSLCVTLRLY